MSRRRKKKVRPRLQTSASSPEVSVKGKRRMDERSAEPADPVLAGQLLSRPPVRLALLATVAAGAFLLRVVPLWGKVFSESGVRLRIADAWYHLRLLEHLTHNFPERLKQDPYALFPNGQWVPISPLLDYVAASIALLFGLGTPKPEVIEAVAAILPPVLGALVVIPVYLLASRLWDARVGLLGALCVAIQPGELFLRSQLGAFDHHVLEVLLSACVLATAVTMTRPGAFDPARKLAALRPALLLALFLSLYLASWSGGVFVVAVLGLWLIARAWLEPRAHDTLETDPEATPALPAFELGVASAALLSLLALAPLAPMLPRFRQTALALLSLTVLAVSLAGWRLWCDRRALPPLKRRVILAVPAGLIAFGAWAPLYASFGSMVAQLQGSSVSLTVNEARPLLLGEGQLDWGAPFKVFGMSVVLAVPGLAFLLRDVKQRRPGTLLFLLWFSATLLLTLQQNRFGYYFSLPVAILAAYTLADLISLADRARHRSIALVVSGALVVLALSPNWVWCMRSTRVDESIGAEWREALTWLREQTPLPFGGLHSNDPASDSPDPYLASTEMLESLLQDEQGYSVLSWWDYGYWIGVVARRPPVTNPTQERAREVAEILLETDDSVALAKLQELGVRYLVVDRELVFKKIGYSPPEGKFDGLVTWAGGRHKGYRDAKRLTRVNDPGTLAFYYPSYYQTLLARLLLFGGEAWDQGQSSYVVHIDKGTLVSKVMRFNDHREATLYLEAGSPGSGPDSDRRLVSVDARRSPVPIAAVPFVEERASFGDPLPDFPGVPAIRIFEVIPPR